MSSLASLFVFVALLFVVISGSRRLLKCGYEPFGPKMCAELGQDSGQPFYFIEDDLSCHRDPTIYTTSIENRVTNLLICNENEMVMKYCIKFGLLPREDICYKSHRAKIQSHPLSRVTTQVTSTEYTAAKQHNCNFTLHQACDEQKICLVQHILTNALADINCRGVMGRTPVMAAANKSQMAVFDLLLSKGCDLSAVDDANDNVLHVASLGGNTYIVRKLIVNEKYDIESKGQYGCTPLMKAAYVGNMEVFELLASFGSNLTATDNYGDNILHFACLGGRFDMVNYIMSKQIIDIESRGSLGRTPLMMAAGRGTFGVFKLLVQKGCNVKVVDDEKYNILHVACLTGNVEMVKYILSLHAVDKDSRGLYGRTPIMMAAEKGHQSVVQVLVRKGCNQKAVDDFKNNILHLACRGGHVRVVRYILSKQIIDIESRGSLGRTPLMKAAGRGKLGVFKLLVRKGCNVKVVDDKKYSILHVACLKGSVEMVKYILSLHAVDKDSRGLYGRTPVMMAAEKGHQSVVQVLVRKGCNQKAVDDFKNNILHLACRGGHVRVVRYILSMHVISRECRGSDGRTPILIAASTGQVDVMNFLVSEGCNLKAVDKFRDNIVHVACRFGHVDAVEYLLSLHSFEWKEKNKYHETLEDCNLQGS